jgi:pimeloyl-ACP methyl ester carboxylesterase
VGPWSFTALAEALAPDHHVVVAHRRGYGASATFGPALSLDGQVADLLELAGGPAAYVGVSGGATLVVALASAHPEAVVAAVVHEPVVGALTAVLHGELLAAATRLAARPGTQAAVEFVEALVGPETWASLDVSARADVAAREAVVRAEVGQFLGFSPTPDDLRPLERVRLISTVGERSRSSRHRAATVVAAYAGNSPRVLPAVGHLAQIDRPGALADALRLAEAVAFDGRGDHDQHVLPTGWSDELQADG